MKTASHFPRPPVIAFLAVNASHSHTPLAAWFLRGPAERAGWTWRLVETTAAEPVSAPLGRLAAQRPSMVAATFYLFNRLALHALLARYKALDPACVILGGGPEFLGDNRLLLQRHPELDAAIRGEGETALPLFLERAFQPARWAEVPGLCAWRGARYSDSGRAPVVRTLDTLVSPYNALMDGFAKPFVPFETARGCSGHCAFCTSNRQPTRTHSMARIRQDLDVLCARGARRIHVIDRTFNERPSRCVTLLDLFRKSYPDVGFHLEIDPARLTSSVLQALARAPAGQLHLEAGVQSLAPKALRRSIRSGTARRTLAGFAALCRLPNVAVHADLIAGLPGATLESLFADVRTLVAQRPAEIQLELLKVLPGTPLDRARDGVVASPEPPYEVLRTDTMTPNDLRTAHLLSQRLDWFYNVPTLQPLVADAARADTDFWPRLIAFTQRPPWARHVTETPSLENRFRLLDAFLREHLPALLPRLHYAWLKHGFSAQHGLCPTQAWKGPLPADATLIEGEASVQAGRIFKADLDRLYWFVYGPTRAACAVYTLQDGA